MKIFIPTHSFIQANYVKHTHLLTRVCPLPVYNKSKKLIVSFIIWYSDSDSFSPFIHDCKNIDNITTKKKEEDMLTATTLLFDRKQTKNNLALEIILWRQVISFLSPLFLLVLVCPVLVVCVLSCLFILCVSYECWKN